VRMHPNHIICTHTPTMHNLHSKSLVILLLDWDSYVHGYRALPYTPGGEKPAVSNSTRGVSSCGMFVDSIADSRAKSTCSYV
jgi:hypothetical protein